MICNGMLPCSLEPFLDGLLHILWSPRVPPFSELVMSLVRANSVVYISAVLYSKARSHSCWYSLASLCPPYTLTLARTTGFVMKWAVRFWLSNHPGHFQPHGIFFNRGPHPPQAPWRHKPFGNREPLPKRQPAVIYNYKPRQSTKKGTHAQPRTVNHDIMYVHFKYHSVKTMLLHYSYIYNSSKNTPKPTGNSLLIS